MRNIFRSGKSKIDVMRGVSVFRDVPRRVLRDIEGHLTELDLPAGRELIHQDASSREFMFIVSGEVDVIRDGVAVATLGAGDVVGETGVLRRQARSASVTTRSPVRLFVAPYVAMKALTSAHPTIAEALHATVNARTAMPLAQG